MNKAELIAQQLATGESWANVVGMEVNPYGVSSYRPLNKAELIARQLVSANQNRETWSKVIFNVMDYHTDNDVNHTAAINRAINDANSWIDSGAKGLRNYPLSKLYRGGVVALPPGILDVEVDKVVMKTGVVIRGCGLYATRINPIGDSGGFTFGRDNTEEWLACIGFEDFSIAPTDEHFAFTTKYDDPPNVSGIDLTLTSQVYMNNVNILNIAGAGIRMQECYDSYYDKMELIFVGTDQSTPAIGMYPGVEIPGGRPASVIDLTNAIHMGQIRIEDCPYGLVIDGNANVNKLLREIQFYACKFEGAPILIKHVFGVTFSACHFTPHGEEPYSPFITVGGDTSDTRGVQFVGCSYISGGTNKRWMFNIVGAGTYDFKVFGGSVTGIKNFLVSQEQKIRITGLSAVSGGTPFISSTGRLRATDCSFYNMVGGDYVINAGSKSRIINCDFDRVDKAISMKDNCVSDYNYFKDIYVHAHYVSDGGNKIGWNNRDDGGVAKMIEYATPSLNLVTFKMDQLATPAPAGYNEQAVISNIGTSGVYGSVTSVTGNGYRYFTNPRAKVVIGGTVSGGETITVKVQTNFDDGTSAYVEKAMTAVGNAWLTEDELATLVVSRLQIRSLSLYAKSSAGSTSATASVKIVANLH